MPDRRRRSPGRPSDTLKVWSREPHKSAIGPNGVLSKNPAPETAGMPNQMNTPASANQYVGITLMKRLRA